MTAPSETTNLTGSGEIRKLQLENLRAEIWKLAAITGDEDALVQALLDKAGPIMGCENIAFMPYDENMKEIKTRLQWRADGKNIGLDETVPRWVFRPYLGKPYVQLSFDRLPTPLKPILKLIEQKYGTRSTLVVPYGNPNRPDGYLAVNNYHRARLYSAAEIDLFIELAKIIHLRSQQLRSQAALQASELRYRQIFETNQAIKLIVDPKDGRIVEANQAAADFYGYDIDTLTRMKMPEINILPEAEIKQLMARTMAQTELDFTFDHKLASGEIRQVEAYPAPINISGQTFIYAIIHDVTERYRAQKALKKVTTLLNESQRIAKIGSFEVDLQTETWVGSDSFIEIFGLPRKEKYSFKEFLAVVHPDDFAEVVTHFSHCLATQQNFDHEYRCLRPDGKVIYIKSFSQLSTHPDGASPKIIGSMQDITQQKLAELALIASETRLSLVLEGAGLGAWDWAIPTGALIVNARWAGMLGYSLDEIEPNVRSWEKLIHPDDKSDTMAQLQAHLEGRTESYRSEHRLRTKTGGWCWILDSGKVIERDANGHPLRATGTHLDITDRKEAEDALRRSEANLSALIENTDGSIWSVDKDYRFIAGNSVFHRDITLALGQPFLPGDNTLPESFGQSSISQWQGHYNRALGGQSFKIEKQRKFIDPPRFVEYRFNPIFAADQTVIGATIYGRDITERKQAEEELRTRLKYEHMLSEISAIAVSADNLQGFQQQCINIMSATLDVSRIYIMEYHANTRTIDNTFEWVAPGIEPQKENLKDLPADLTPWWTEMMHANRVINASNIADIPSQPERELLAKQDIKSILAVPLFVAENFFGFIGFDECRDHRDWLERDVQTLLSAARIIATTIERKQMARQLVQQERLAAVGQLAAGVAHDFNNILAVTLGFAEILRNSPDTPPTSYRSLDQIITAGQRAAHLVRQILDFSQKTIRRPEQIDLGLFLKESLLFLNHTLPENIQLDLQIEPGEYFIQADPTQLQQMLTNLAINARDAMRPDGGRLQLYLSRAQESGDRICAVCQRRIEGTWLRLSVSDSGQGISPRVLPRIFEPFFTTKAVGQGVGLGLSQVSGIISQHQGHINIESAPGQGTTINIYLPLMTPVTPGFSQPNHAVNRTGHGETILLVEDDPFVQEATEAMLQHFGYRVIIAATGQQALSLFHEHQVNINLVLSDMILPDISGEELLRQLRDRSPALKLVLMSGYPLTEKAPELLEMGASWFLKPISFDKLSQVIDQTLKDKIGRWD